MGKSSNTRQCNAAQARIEGALVEWRNKGEWWGEGVFPLWR